MDYEVIIDIKNADRDLTGKEDHFEPNLMTLVDDLSNVYKNAARDEIHVKTGFAKGSHAVEFVNPFNSLIYSDAPYIIEYMKGRKGFSAKGLRAGAPKQGSFFAGANMGAVGYAKALYFEYEGKMIFRRSVGPSKGDPYIERAIRRAEGPKERKVQEFIKKVES